MQVTIPYSMWFECQLYLNHNYIMPVYDYKITADQHAYTLEFNKTAHYEQFMARYALRLK